MHAMIELASTMLEERRRMKDFMSSLTCACARAFSNANARSARSGTHREVMACRMVVVALCDCFPSSAIFSLLAVREDSLSSPFGLAQSFHVVSTLQSSFSIASFSSPLRLAESRMWSAVSECMRSATLRSLEILAGRKMCTSGTGETGSWMRFWCES
jgi:hypothetical protein